MKNLGFGILLIAVWALGGWQSAPQVKGLAVQVVGQTDKNVTYQIINQSREMVAGYTIAIDLIHADGTVDHDERTTDYGSPTKGLQPQASIEETAPLEPNLNNHSPITDVVVKPWVAIYANGTAEAHDADAFHRIADVRTGVAEALQISVNAIQQAIANQQDQSPSVTASGLVKHAAAEAKISSARRIAGQPVPADAGWLRDIADNLDHIPKQAAQEQITERECLNKYLVALQRQLRSYAPHAQVHLGGQQ